MLVDFAIRTIDSLYTSNIFEWKHEILPEKGDTLFLDVFEDLGMKFDDGEFDDGVLNANFEDLITFVRKHFHQNRENKPVIRLEFEFGG